ncbi:MAG TPA: hypothetical protein VK675_01060 [Candidatus Paceibacterota bacterium]|nr:hypothetical protein [Candidatus Paceibacterota bacterium]
MKKPIDTIETRRGFFFTAQYGELGRDGHIPVIPITLLIEGDTRPLATIRVPRSLAQDKANVYIDQAWQEWIVSESFNIDHIEEPLRSVLQTYRAEHKRPREVEDLSYRFIPAKNNTRDKPRWILTTDKTDLEEKKREFAKHRKATEEYYRRMRKEK